MSFSLCGKHSKHTKKGMEQHFQDVAQKLQYNKNSYTFAAHCYQNLYHKPTTQQCCEIMKSEISSMVYHIGSMKNWSNSSCMLCKKAKSEIISCSQRRYRKLIDACSEVYIACWQNPICHRFNRNLLSS